MTRRGQPYGFSLADSLLAEVAQIPQSRLHTDVDAICRAYEAIVPLAQRLGIEKPRPALAGLAYNHVSTLGCKIVIVPDAPEPAVLPCIHEPEDIDALVEPEDYLSEGIVPQRLEMLEKLKARRPEASDHIGHDYEGPITTAVLMMGQAFFLLAYDDPARAHRLLDFSVRSAVNYAAVLRAHQGRPAFRPGGGGFCDDFGGIFRPEMFKRFVVPCWEAMYQGIQATTRGLHSELLREEHLEFLAELGIDTFDPSCDQYLTPEMLRRSCPVKYTLRMFPAEVMVHSAAELVEMYRRRASFEPTTITFSLSRAVDEPKIAALLEVARELA